MLKKLILLTCVASSLCLHAPANGVDWHVNREVGGEVDRSQAVPFATLIEARDAVRLARQSREIPEPDVIWIHPGIYVLDDTVELNHEDSGTEDAPITWRAVEPNKATLSGRDLSVLLSIYDAEHIRVEGLNLVNAIDQAVEVAHCQRVAIVNCSVSNSGDTGIHVFGGRDCKVSSCSIIECRKIGIRVEAGDRETLSPANHLVEACRIEKCGQGIAAESAAIHVAGVASKVLGNRITDCENSGIRIDGNDHAIIGNHLERTCLSAVNVGAIFHGHDSTERGNRIERNSIIQVGESPRLDAIAIFLSEGASDTVVHQNLISSAGRGIGIGGGNANVITENMIEDCTIAIQLENRGDQVATLSAGESNRIERNLLQRSGSVAVDSTETFRVNRISENRIGRQLFVLNRQAGSATVSLMASKDDVLPVLAISETPRETVHVEKSE